jgi:hypothetical protein
MRKVETGVVDISCLQMTKENRVNDGIIRDEMDIISWVIRKKSPKWNTEMGLSHRTAEEAHRETAAGGWWLGGGGEMIDFRCWS